MWIVLISGISLHNHFLARLPEYNSDQTVETDLKELRDLDVESTPQGYTPFCDSRAEQMEGFRFWKSGYWRNHLQGRKYHISALYVVDLKRFRKIAAGDRLRGQYQALSQDPNSLSNLGILFLNLYNLKILKHFIYFKLQIRIYQIT